MPTLPFVAACCLAAVHLLAGHLRALDRIPRSRWLSLGGGVSVAYVFIHMLPELEERQAAFETAGSFAGFLDRHVYVVALAGFAAFYVLERLAQRSRDGEAVAGAETTTSESVFWIHIGLFGLYNVLVGYLLVHRPDPSLADVLLFTAAMALHFFVNDYGLRHHHLESYHRVGAGCSSSASSLAGPSERR